MRIFILCFFLFFGDLLSENESEYLSPSNLISDRDGKFLYIVESTAKKIAVLNLSNYDHIEEISLPLNPSDLLLDEENNLLYVTAGTTKGKVYEINLDSKLIVREYDVGHSPNSPIISNDNKFLYVNNQFNNDISVVDLSTGIEVKRIPVVREPFSSVITPNGKFLFVANLIPYGPADLYDISSVISVIDLTTKKLLKNIKLPNGSNAVHGINISNDGKFVYAVHILARYQMPTTQLEKGWINTNALSIIDVENLSFLNTVLLDNIDLGAANPWDVQSTKDDKYLCVSHTGTHELSIIDQTKLIKKLFDAKDGLLIADKYKSADWIKNDLAFMADIRRRVPLKGLGPRGISISGNRVYIAEYFSGTIGVVDIDDKYNHKLSSISLGSKKIFSAVRMGELLFHDGRQCFQKWQSCFSCHPGGARSDALNWDLLNDGIGNPKNSKSLLLSHVTPPAMSTGVRDRAETAVRAGVKYIQFAVLPEEDLSSIDEYLKSLEPLESPYLIDGKLSQSAERGEVIFNKAKCINCHSTNLFTDLKQYNIGTGKGKDANIKFDTPTLIENWRTAPYLHDGRAATMHEVLTKFNPEDKHGITSNLTDNEIDDLVEYILSQ